MTTESLILQMPMEHFLYVWGWGGHQMLRPNSGPGKERGGVLTWPENGREASVTSELRGKARKTFPGVGCRGSMETSEALPACTCGVQCADGDLGRLLCFSGPNCPPLKNDSMNLRQQFSGAVSESLGGLGVRFLGPSDPGALGSGHSFVSLGPPWF